MKNDKPGRPRKYWSDLKAKLKKEGSELSEKIGQLKMAADDGKMRNPSLDPSLHSGPSTWRVNSG